jgi:hypothetical protein
MTGTDGDAEAPCDCKVGRIAARHGLVGVHDEFERRWGGGGDDGVRDLAEAFNRRVLRAGVERAGRTPLDGEVENLYRVLTDDEVDAGSRTQARERLRRDGVPVGEIEDGFVSHQTVYRHLVDCLGVSREPAHEDAASRIAAWRDRILSLETRLARVTERGIDQLREADAAAVGSFQVYVDVNLFCDDCGRLFTVEEFLDDPRCDCQPSDDWAE